MTMYKDFIKDFPGRCRDVLNFNYDRMKWSDREVTLLLLAASGGFVIPYERLREPPKGKPSHPAGGRSKFEKSTKDLDELLSNKCKFLNSALWENGPGSWKFLKKVPSELIEKPLEDWGLEEARLVSKEKTAKSILKIIRNALAHGNVYVNGVDIIQELLFLNQPFEDARFYELLLVAPDDFQFFLEKWFEFLSTTTKEVPSLKMIFEKLDDEGDEAA
ncbi:hypothetical protein ACFLQ0_04375 [Nitrospinota bacterium]